MKNIKKLFLKINEVYVSEKNETITTVLGSCVSICLFDNINKTIGMNHYSLPEQGKDLSNKLIKEMVNKGSSIENLVAKIFGGSNSFDTVFNIGEKNINIAFNVLELYNIPIKSKCVGGSFGRKIIFDSESGIVKRWILNNNK